MPPAAAIIGAGQTALNYAGAKKAKKTAGNQVNAAVNAYGDYGHQLDALYRQAFGALAGYGASGKADILDNQKSLMANTAQSLANRGLYNTTALDSANRGIAHSTNRSLAQLNEDLGLMKANLYTGLAAQKGQIASGLAGIRMGVQPTFTPTNLLGPLQQLQSIQQGGGFGSIFGSSPAQDGGFPTWGTGG